MGKRAYYPEGLIHFQTTTGFRDNSLALCDVPRTKQRPQSSDLGFPAGDCRKLEFRPQHARLGCPRRRRGGRAWTVAPCPNGIPDPEPDRQDGDLRQMSPGTNDVRYDEGTMCPCGFASSIFRSLDVVLECWAGVRTIPPATLPEPKVDSSGGYLFQLQDVPGQARRLTPPLAVMRQWCFTLPASHPHTIAPRQSVF